MTGDLFDWGARTALPPPAQRRFNGADYVPERDQARLSGQIERVYNATADGAWHTLAALAAVTGDPEPSVSAQLRHLRKPRFGSHVIERRHLGNGLYAYRRAAPAARGAAA